MQTRYKKKKKKNWRWETDGWEAAGKDNDQRHKSRNQNPRNTQELETELQQGSKSEVLSWSGFKEQVIPLGTCLSQSGVCPTLNPGRGYSLKRMNHTSQNWDTKYSGNHNKESY